MRKIRSVVALVLVIFCATTCGLVDKLGDCVVPKPISEASFNWCKTAYVHFKTGYNAPVQYGAETSRDIRWILPEGVEFVSYGTTASGGENKEGVYVRFNTPGTYKICAQTFNECGETTPACRDVQAVVLKNEVPYPYDELVGRTYPAGGYANGRIYFGLGMFGGSLYDWYSYDLDDLKFTPRASFPSSEQFYYMRSVSLNDKIYVMTEKGRMWEYDPVNNNWNLFTTFPQGDRADFTMYTIGSKIYITGGRQGADLFSEHWAFDPSSKGWERKADRPFLPSFHAIGTESNGLGYVAGGFTDQTSVYANAIGNNNPYIHVYDPVIDQWNEVSEYGGIPVCFYMKDDQPILRTNRGLYRVTPNFIIGYSQNDDYLCTRQINRQGHGGVNIQGPGFSAILGGRDFTDQGEYISDNVSFGFTIFYQ